MGPLKIIFIALTALLSVCFAGCSTEHFFTNFGIGNLQIEFDRHTNILSEVNIIEFSKQYFASAGKSFDESFNDAFHIKGLLMDHVYYCELMNGIRIEFSYLSANSYKVKFTYEDAKNELSQSKIVSQDLSRPIISYERGGIFEFYDAESGKFVLTEAEKGSFNHFVAQNIATGTMPGSIGSVLAFRQTKNIFIVKKLSAKSCRILRMPTFFDTSHFPHTNKIDSLLGKKSKLPNGSNAASTGIFAPESILFCVVFIGVLISVTRWAIIKRNQRHNFRARRRRVRR